MGFWYSDNFDYVTDGTYEPGQLVPGEIKHGRVRKKRMYKNLTAATLGRTNGDEIVLGTFKSGDRLYSLKFTSSANNAAGVVDLGFKKANLDHDPTTMALVAPAGATSITDIFYDGKVLSTALSQDDAFTSATDLRQVDRGLRLWELANKKITAGGGTVFASDPMADWDLVLLFATGASATALEILVEAEFTAAG